MSQSKSCPHCHELNTLWALFCWMCGYKFGGDR